MSRGPCEHLLALLWLAQPLRRDTQSSVVVAADEARGPALGPPASAGRAAAANGADDADEGGDEFDDERGAGDDD